MTLWLTDIPEDDTQLAVWLEFHLFDVSLGELVNQLEVMVSIPAVSDLLALDRARLPRFDSWAPALREQVLSRGLVALDHDHLRSLLIHPADLHELQLLVFGQQHGYWGRKLAIADRLSEKRLVSQSMQPTVDSVAEPVSATPKTPQGSNSLWILALVAAVAVLATLSWYVIQPPSESVAMDWGWDQPGLVGSDLGASEYLESLAQAADRWRSEDRATPNALLTRLKEVRHGCDTILASDHRALAEVDRAWLLERCGAWREKIEEQIAELESSDGSYAKVLQTSDEIMNKLVVALRARAAEAV